MNVDQPREDREQARLTSTSGYAEEAAALGRRYEAVTFEAAFGNFLPYMPEPPCRVADIGAGTGRDAAWLTERGYEVTAVEPVPEMRAVAQQLHGDVSVRWIDDALPGLDKLSGEFGLILMRAVWMHLDASERARALPRIAALLAEGGRVMMTLRHGPVPPGRRMFEVALEEIFDAGAPLGLKLLHRGHSDDTLGRADVTWSCLVLERRSRLQVLLWGNDCDPGEPREIGVI